MYALHNAPVWEYKKWFQKIDTIFRELVWKGSLARIRLNTLQLQKRDGGIALPHAFSYFLASQLQHMGGCNTEEGELERKMLLQNTLHRSLVETMEAGSFPWGQSAFDLMMRVWDAAKAALGYRGFTEYTPLWENSNLGGNTENRDKQGMGKRRNKLHYPALPRWYSALKFFQDLSEQYTIPKKYFFRYLQIRHALAEKFRERTLEWSKMPLLQKPNNAKTLKGLIYKVYPCIHKGSRGGIEALS